jgi:hypothetical protein
VAPSGIPGIACLAVVAGAAFVACDDEAGRPPPPPPVDAAPEEDAGPLPDAGDPPDAGEDGGGGTETIRRDYGTDFEACPAFQFPVWGDLSWEASIPEGASLRFSAQAAPAGESLGGAQRVTLGTAPPATPPLYVSDELPAEHRNDPQLRISILSSWPTQEARPTLDALHLDWVCLDRE